MWGLSPDGEYSVKMGARLIQVEFNHYNEDVDFKCIWKWKACNDGLSTKSRLEKSHVFLPSQCEFCNFHSESAIHLFFDFPFMLDILQKLNEDFNWPLMPHNCELDQLSFCRTLNLCLKESSMKQIQAFAFSWWFV